MPPLPLQENVLNAKKHPTDACKEPRRCESSTPSSSFARAVGSAPDPILSVGVAFEADSSPYKINLGIGAYRSADGSAYVLPSVQEAEAKLLHSQAIGQLNKEYLPSQGLGQFCEESVRLLLGDDCAAIAEGRVATVQSISGTGGFHLAARIISELFPGQPYQPNTRTVLSQYCHQYEFARAFPRFRHLPFPPFPQTSQRRSTRLQWRNCARVGMHPPPPSMTPAGSIYRSQRGTSTVRFLNSPAFLQARTRTSLAPPTHSIGKGCAQA